MVVASIIIMAGLSVAPSPRVGHQRPGDSVADLRLIALFVRAYRKLWGGTWRAAYFEDFLDYLNDLSLFEIL